MVAAIVNTMNVNSFTSKDVHIVYDNGLDVQFFLDEKLTGQKQEKKGIQLSFEKKADQGASDSSSNNGKGSGTIVHKKAWGKYVTESEQGEIYTTTRIERDLVDFMISEFQEHGYRVVSIEAPETALLYLRKMVPYTYDALNKLVIYAKDKNSGTFYEFTKDAPAGTKPFHFDDIQVEKFVDQTIGVIKEEIRKSSLHNPHVMLVGDAFEDPDEYREICECLKEEGIVAIDIYSIWRDKSAPLNSVRVISPPDLNLDVDGRYGLAICLLARTMESKPENMVEGFHPMFLDKKTKRMLTEGVSFAASLFLIYGIIVTGVGLYENHVAQGEYTRASNTTESQLAIAEQGRDASKAKLEGLNTIDSRYNDIFKFVYAQVSDDLNIASVDTQDMIPTTTSSSSDYAATQPTTDDGTAATDNTQDTSATTDPNAAQDTTVNVTQSAAQAYSWQTIVIRGYSRTTEGPMELHNALVKAGLGEVKVVGIEQVHLPSKETLFAFELTVGTNEGV